MTEKCTVEKYCKTIFFKENEQKLNVDPLNIITVGV